MPRTLFSCFSVSVSSDAWWKHMFNTFWMKFIDMNHKFIVFNVKSEENNHGWWWKLTLSSRESEAEQKNKVEMLSSGKSIESIECNKAIALPQLYTSLNSIKNDRLKNGKFDLKHFTLRFFFFTVGSEVTRSSFNFHKQSIDFKKFNHKSTNFPWWFLCQVKRSLALALAWLFHWLEQTTKITSGLTKKKWKDFFRC